MPLKSSDVTLLSITEKPSSRSETSNILQKLVKWTKYRWNYHASTNPSNNRASTVVFQISEVLKVSWFPWHLELRDFRPWKWQSNSFSRPKSHQMSVLHGFLIIYYVTKNSRVRKVFFLWSKNYVKQFGDFQTSLNPSKNAWLDFANSIHLL